MAEYTPSGPMSERDFAHYIARELNKTHGLIESNVKSYRYKGMRYYYRELPLAPEKPRSGIRSTDIPDVNDAMLAEILPMFNRTDSLCQLTPLHSGDKRQAAEESKALNYIFFEMCDGETVIHDLLMDGLLQRNATPQCEVLEDFKTEFEDFGPADERALSLRMQEHLQRRPNETLEVVGRDERQDGTSIYKLRRTWAARELKVMVHPPENVYVCTDHDELSLKNARFVALLVTPTRSDLVELGVDYNTAYNELPAYTRQRDYDAVARHRQTDQQIMRAAHKSGELVECYRCFYRIDTDGDGVAELHDVLFSKPNHILDDTIVNESYLSSFSPWSVPHNWSGTGLVDKLEEIVNAKTTFLRETVDNVIRANNHRLECVKGKVDPASVQSTDPLAPIWVTEQGAAQPIQFNNVGEVGYRMLDYLDKIRREQVGSTLDLQTSQSMAVPGDTAHGVERTMTTLEKQSALVAVELKKTLESVFRDMHELLRKSDYGEFVYMSEGTPMVATPSQWPERTRVCVQLGLSEGQKIQMLTALESVFQKQMQLMQQANGTLVTQSNVHETLIRQATVAGLNNPESLWTDPQSPQAMQAAQQQQMQAMQAAQAQQAAQERAMQLQEQLARATAENERMKTQLDAMIKNRKQRLDEIKAVDDSAQGWTDLEIQADKDLGNEGRFKQ